MVSKVTAIQTQEPEFRSQEPKRCPELAAKGNPDSSGLTVHQPCQTSEYKVNKRPVSNTRPPPDTDDWPTHRVHTLAPHNTLEYTERERGRGQRQRDREGGRERERQKLQQL